MLYDINFWVGFLGLGATVLFGILSIYIVKSQRYPVEITLLVEESIFLYDRVVKNIKDLEITYQGFPIKENMVLLKGFFIHTGTKDVTQDMVEEKLSMTLPPNSIWHNATIVKTSAKLHVDATISNEHRTILFDLGLFKRSEYFYFEALAETNSSFKIGSDINIDQRISDSGKIATVTSEEFSKGHSYWPNIAGLAFVLMLFWFLCKIFLLEHPEMKSVPSGAEYARSAEHQSKVDYDTLRHALSRRGTVVQQSDASQAMSDSLLSYAISRYDGLRLLNKRRYTEIQDTVKIIDSLIQNYSNSHYEIQLLFRKDAATYTLSNGLTISLYSTKDYFMVVYSIIMAIIGFAMAFLIIKNGVKKYKYRKLIYFIK